MVDWSLDAKNVFRTYCDLVRPRLEAEGADAEEVYADLRRHIEADLKAAGIGVITEHRLRQSLARIAPETVGVLVTAPPSSNGHGARNPHPSPGEPTSSRTFVWLSLLGVALPIMAILAASTFFTLAGTPFDPIPTWRHFLLVSMVPVGNLLMLLIVGDVWRPPLRWVGIASAVTIGIAAYYTLLFAVLLPVAVIAILFYGIGLLPMAPLFSLIAALRCRRHVGRKINPQASAARLPGWGWGLLIAMLLLIASDLPTYVTTMAMDRALNSGDPTTQNRAVSFLRVVGDRQVMRLACYGRSAPALTGALSRLLWEPTGSQSNDDWRGVRSEEDRARRLYYRVTGQSHAAAFKENFQFRRRGEESIDWDERFDLGLDVGGDLVGPVVRHLALDSSRLDGSLAPDGALGYLEWTMEFQNSSGSTWRQEEARAQILLPPGGAVTRLTLWVNGQEREAVFAGKDQARQAYRQVTVRERRDPVLVTSCGPDQVMMQCFPVPPGGKMKVRMGVTFPLPLETAERGALRLPQILDRNFTIAEGFTHATWIESRQPLKTALAGMTAENPKAGLFAVRGQLKDADLGGPAPVILAERPGKNLEAWTRDPVTGHGAIVQRLESRTVKAPSRVVLVIDGSESVGGQAAALAAALDRFPEGIELAAVLAGDAPQVLQEPVEADRAVLQKLSKRIGKYSYAGGADNLPALLAAWDLAAQRPDGVILWVHGGQPLPLSPAAPLLQGWERRPGTPRLLAVAVAPKFNELFKDFDGRPEVALLPRLGALNEDLERLFARWAGKSPEWVAVRERLAETSATQSRPGQAASAHLARLWALDECRRLTALGKPDAARQAMELAVRQRLVTPLTGAVVLETDAQYKQNELTPPSAVGIPTIPEPGEWALIGVCLFVLGLAWMRRRRRGCVASA